MMKQQGCSWMLETGEICIDRTTQGWSHVAVVDIYQFKYKTKHIPCHPDLYFSSCRLVITAMTEQCCKNIVIMAEQHC